MDISRRAFVAATLAGTLRVAAAAKREGTGVFQAGAATVDITPEPGVKIDGVIARGGPGTGAHDRLYAKSLALDDGATRLVLTICDVRMIGRRICDEAKRLASQRANLTTSNILVAATHTHAAPTPIDLFDDEPYLRWQQTVIDGIAASMVKAVSNLAPAKLGRASMRKPEHCFNRRWKLRDDASMPPNPFGGTDDKVLANPSSRREQLREPAGPVDDELSVISLRRASDDQPLAMLANYSTHYIGGYAGTLVSSDYYGVFSERVKELLAPTGDPPFVAMMFNGTSGDVNANNFAGKPDASPPWVRMAKVGDDMARSAVALAESIQHRASIQLRAAVRELELGVRKPDAQRIAWAQSILSDPLKNRGLAGRYAGETLEIVKYPDRVKLLVQAMRIGDFAIAAMPAEVFAETGLEIKRRSPIKFTINIGLANGYNGYLPTPEQHALGGYETWLARSSYLEVDASNKIRDAALALLNEVE
ncbi:MAG: neutral/alkaline non-lysosomal ceramidase N-terminal domain-containing protein [Gemmatimonadaceae bacterium]|nr:neutral/alkaline non-lysosomal ceramidase N-terminal domain-containing protein [Gemmatimonadaceae bacterium]